MWEHACKMGVGEECRLKIYEQRVNRKVSESSMNAGEKPVQIIGPRLCCICSCLCRQYYYLSIWHINPFTPNAIHFATDSQSSRYTENIFGRFALLGARKKTLFLQDPTPLSRDLFDFKRKGKWVVRKLLHTSKKKLRNLRHSQNMSVTTAISSSNSEILSLNHTQQIQ